MQSIGLQRVPGLSDWAHTHTVVSKTKRQPSEWRKHLQTEQLTKDQSQKYTKSSCNSMSKIKNKLKMYGR